VAKKSKTQDTETPGSDELRKTLHELSADVDEEGLHFLIDQARVLIHNKRVGELNKKLKDAHIEVSERKVKGAARPAKAHEVEIVERGEGKHFFIVVNHFHIFFTLEEMRRLVKICHGSADEKEAARRLYNWFKRFRSDFLNDGGIEGPRNPSLADLYRRLVSTYRPREG
jgi:hypothetical protein